MDLPNCRFGGCAEAGLYRKACTRCGFDRTEDQLRRMILAQRGLTKDPRTGLYRLALKRRKRK